MKYLILKFILIISFFNSNIFAQNYYKLEAKEPYLVGIIKCHQYYFQPNTNMLNNGIYYFTTKYGLNQISEVKDGKTLYTYEILHLTILDIILPKKCTMRIGNDPFPILYKTDFQNFQIERLKKLLRNYKKGNYNKYKVN